jgi:hypothetical protein
MKILFDNMYCYFKFQKERESRLCLIIIETPLGANRGEPPRLLKNSNVFHKARCYFFLLTPRKVLHGFVENTLSPFRVEGGQA